MAKAPFKTNSEGAYADYLTQAGLAFEYERLWGTRRPDFTISRSPADKQPIAIADIKDLNMTIEEEAKLKAGEIVTINRNPAMRTRRQIADVWLQFEACTGYPCILVLAPGSDHPPEPLYAMAAMIGDYTIVVGTSPDREEMTIGQAFGNNGKMLDGKGNPMNTRISAVALMSSICPDAVYSGYIDQVHELGKQMLGGDDYDKRKEAAHQYLAACNDVREKLTADGYELDATATQIEYVLNPLAAAPLPTAELARGYVRVWEYDYASQTLAVTYDWTKLPKP